MTDIVKSVSIDALLMKRDAAMERLKAANKCLIEAGELLAGTHCSVSYAIRGNRYHDENTLLSSDGFDTQRKRIDAQLWQYLMQESGLRTFMDSRARQEWDKQISECKTPELTRANVEATFKSLYGARGDMFERGVIEVFRGLSWCYKTNMPQKFGKRIVIGFIRSYHGSGQDKLDDLDRFLHVMDGKPEPDHRDSAGCVACSKAREKSTGVVDLPYLSVKWFKNGNAHVTFKRLDLVDQMNRIIAKHYPVALPAPK